VEPTDHLLASILHKLTYVQGGGTGIVLSTSPAITMKAFDKLMSTLQRFQTFARVLMK
jgi:hypothetical protein